MTDAYREFFTVRMLGEFSIVCEGKELILGRNSSLKCIQLLQLVWLRGKKGVGKEQLAKALYDRSNVADTNNSVNNLIYQLRRQMVKAGLPKGEYVTRVDGVYIPDPEYPLKLDVHEFEELLDQAEQTTDQREKHSFYQAAFEVYRGELLPSISTEIWVMSENLRLKKRYECCVQWLAEYYRSQKDYAAMEALYEHVIQIDPDDNWKICQIDLLMDKGEYKRAYAMYNDMVQRYADEMGLPASPEMMACYERMNSKIRHMPGEMDEIMKGIRNRFQSGGGYESDDKAYYCSYLGFVDICHMVNRNMDRSGRSYYLMLCTLVDYEGKCLQNEKKRKERAQILKDVIGNSLRKGDVYTQYNNSQYLILLIAADESSCEIVYRRINNNLKKVAGSRAEMEYVVCSLSELPPPVREE